MNNIARDHTPFAQARVLMHARDCKRAHVHDLARV